MLEIPKCIFIFINTWHVYDHSEYYGNRNKRRRRRGKTRNGHAQIRSKSIQTSTSSQNYISMKMCIRNIALICKFRRIRLSMERFLKPCYLTCGYLLNCIKAWSDWAFLTVTWKEASDLISVSFLFHLLDIKNTKYQTHA